MSLNPLQQYFRQPKVFVRLPSHGIYNKPGALEGDIENIPVFGMTGMDEILLKTPDALISGEATVKVIQSCCPSVKDAWDISNLDIDALLVAVRIATYGNSLEVVYTCKNCQTQAEYDVDLGKILEHFNNCVYDSKVVIGDLTVKLRPLTYKEVTTFNLENFILQKKLSQIIDMTDEDAKQKALTAIFKDLGELQNKVYIAGVEAVEMPNVVVTEHAYIKEWLENTERSTFEALKNHITKNNDDWRIPSNHAKCTECGHEDDFSIEMDQANFFASA
jgi:RNase P subunit RPR2